MRDNINKSNKPLVSVIIPVYNAEKYIKETLESVLNQTYDNWELICVDDGSSDSSISIIEEYRKKDKRVISMKRTGERKGGSVCRNIGAYSSNGKYLIFLDSDDCLSQDCIKFRVDMIDTSKNDFVVFPVGYFSNDVRSYKIYNKLSSKKPLYCFAAASPAWQTMQAIIRKDFFLSIHGFDEKYQRFQDIEFYFRALLTVGNHYLIVNNNLPDCFFRHDGLSGDMTPDKMKKSLDSCRYLFDLVSDNSYLLASCKKLYLVFGAIICNYKIFSFRLGYNNDVYDFSSKSNFGEICAKSPCIVKKMLLFLLDLKKSSFNMFVVRAFRKGIDYVLYNF